MGSKIKFRQDAGHTVEMEIIGNGHKTAFVFYDNGENFGCMVEEGDPNTPGSAASAVYGCLSILYKIGERK